MEKVKSFFKEYLNKNTILTYIYGEFASRLLGFIVGLWAVSLVGHFFEYPNFRNLWGFNSHKALVSKATFEELKWIAQVIIGFFVFEVFHKTVFTKITAHAPFYYKKGINYLEETGVMQKVQDVKTEVNAQIKKTVLKGKEKFKESYNKKLK